MKTTINVRFRASTSMPGSGTPLIQITRRRLTTTISCSCVVSSEEWNNDRNEVVIPEKASSRRKKELTALIRKLKKDVRQLQQTAETLESRGDYSAKELANYLKSRNRGRCFASMPTGKSRSFPPKTVTKRRIFSSMQPVAF